MFPRIISAQEELSLCDLCWLLSSHIDNGLPSAAIIQLCNISVCHQDESSMITNKANTAIYGGRTCMIEVQGLSFDDSAICDTQKVLFQIFIR